MFFINALLNVAWWIEIRLCACVRDGNQARWSTSATIKVLNKAYVGFWFFFFNFMLPHCCSSVNVLIWCEYKCGMCNVCARSEHACRVARLCVQEFVCCQGLERTFLRVAISSHTRLIPCALVSLFSLLICRNATKRTYLIWFCRVKLPDCCLW